jgi:hypothetical protein
MTLRKCSIFSGKGAVNGESVCATQEIRQQRRFAGSDVIEAGCKTGIGSRLKQSGVFWTGPGSQCRSGLRCSQLNGRF